MNDNIESQLGQYNFKRGINGDLKIAVDLSSSHKELNEFDIVRVLSLDDQFNKERINSPMYRLHGTINSISPITGRKVVWDSVDDMFDEANKIGFASITDYFDFYLCYPSEMIPLQEGSGLYTRNATILSKLEDLNLLECGFAISSFSEKVWNFVLNEAYNLGDLRTKYACSGETCLNLPVTEVFIMAHPKIGFQSKEFKSDYKPVDSLSEASIYGYNESELEASKTLLKAAINTHVKPSSYRENGVEVSFSELTYGIIVFLFKMLNLKLTDVNIKENKEVIKKYLGLGNISNFKKVAGKAIVNVGDVVLCDLVQFNKESFEIKRIDNQELYIKKSITLPLSNSSLETLTGSNITYTASPAGLTTEFSYKLNPFMEIKLRDYSGYVETGDPLNTDLIPEYAVTGVNGVKTWRDLLDIGYIEPETGRGADYPYINGNHYIYANLLLVVSPDMDVSNTYKAYRSYFMRNEISHYSKNINKFK
jgi:hypothetical protein